VCVMAGPYETFKSVDSNGMLVGGGQHSGMRRKSAKRTLSQSNSIHPRLQNMGAPIAICTNQTIRSGNSLTVMRVCNTDSLVIDDSMNHKLSMIAIDEPKKSTKRNSQKTRRLRTNLVNGSKRRTKKQ